MTVVLAEPDGAVDERGMEEQAAEQLLAVRVASEPASDGPAYGAAHPP
ncbi:MAG: hypothetical protein KY412_01030 [Actinobacteria bacterium]|nr:hypothetical protein [Actinomycetota bacterium]